MTDHSVDYLRRLHAAVDDFSAAFDDWMATQVESDMVTSRGLLPTVWVADGQDSREVRALELRVAETAGGAARAVSVTGAYIIVAGAGALDPITNWSMMASPKAMLSPHDVRSAAANVKGRLATMIAESEAAESGIPGFAPSQMHPLIWGPRPRTGPRTSTGWRCERRPRH